MSIKNWVESAILAAHVLKEDVHYVVKKGKIIPVDYRNTGCLQNNV
jgi:preprotein translocase subunit SecA